MLKTRFGQILLVGALIIGVLFSVSGCFPSGGKSTKDDAKQTQTTTKTATVAAIQSSSYYNFYNAVNLDQPKSEVEKALGVTAVIDSTGVYRYNDGNTGYGVMIRYDENNKVKDKAIIFPEGAPEIEAMNPTQFTEAQFNRITNGMTYQEVKKILGGEGIEVMYGRHPEYDMNDVYTMAWFNPNKTMVTVYLNGFEGTVVDAELVDK